MSENNIMQEALSALEGRIELAQPKFPEGASVIGLHLDRDPAVSAKYVTQVAYGSWQTGGLAVAIKDGHVIASNAVLGHFVEGKLKVNACHYVQCDACKRKTLQPLAVFEKKQEVKKAFDIDVPDDMTAAEIFRKWGGCHCGGAWHVDREREKSELAELAEKTLDKIAQTEKVGMFVPPTLFEVLPIGANAPRPDESWTWMMEAMRKLNKVVTPYIPPMHPNDMRERDVYRAKSLMLFSPDFWIGYVLNHHDSNLFWVEDGSSKKEKRHAASLFNPAGIEGL